MNLRPYRKKFVLFLGTLFLTIFFITSITYFNDNLWNRNLEAEKPNQQFLVRDIANRNFNQAEYDSVSNITKKNTNVYRKNFIKNVYFILTHNYYPVLSKIFLILCYLKTILLIKKKF